MTENNHFFSLLSLSRVELYLDFFDEGGEILDQLKSKCFGFDVGESTKRLKLPCTVPF